MTTSVSPGARARADEGTALPIQVEVRGIVEAPLGAVRSVLLDLEGFGRWFPATGAWRVLARTAEDAARVYGRQTFPWPVADRDYVVDYRWWDEAGAFVLLATALTDAEPTSPEGVVRVERMRTEWRVAAAPNGTAVRYRYEGESLGPVPDWVARASWRSRTPLVIEGLRDELSRRAAAR